MNIQLRVGFVLVLLSACNDPHLQIDSSSNGGVGGTSDVRVIQVDDDVASLGLYTDTTGFNANADLSVDYGESSGYQALAADIKDFVMAADTQAQMHYPISLERGASYSLFAFKGESGLELVQAKDERTAATDKVKIRFVHAASDAGAVDVRQLSSAGPLLFANRNYKSISDYVEVASGVQLVVSDAGADNARFSYDLVDLEAGRAYTAVWYGSVDASDDVDLHLRVFADTDSGDAFVDLSEQSAVPVMLVNLDPAISSADLLVDDKVLISALSYPSASAYTSGASSSLHKIAVAPQGMQAQSFATLALDPAFAYSIFISPTSSMFISAADDLSAPSNGKAKLRFARMLTDKTSAKLEVLDGSTSVSTIERAQTPAVSEFIEIDAGTYDLQVKGADDAVLIGPSQSTFQAGKIYTYIAYGDFGMGTIDTLTVNHN